MKRLIFTIIVLLGISAKAVSTNWMIIEGTMKNLEKNIITLATGEGDVNVFKSSLMEKEKQYVSGKVTKAKVTKEEFVLLNVIY